MFADDTSVFLKIEVKKLSAVQHNKNHKVISFWLC